MDHFSHQRFEEPENHVRVPILSDLSNWLRGPVKPRSNSVASNTSTTSTSSSNQPLTPTTPLKQQKSNTKATTTSNTTTPITSPVGSPSGNHPLGMASRPCAFKL